MRLLFISGTAGGGAAISTIELARHMADRGHVVGLLMRTREAELGLSAIAGAWHPRGLFKRARRSLERLLLRRPAGPVASDHGEVWTARHIEAVVARVVDQFEPDVLVVNSVHSRAWGAIRRLAARRALPTVLYLREHSAVQHIVRGELPDLVVANAHAHAAAVASLGVHAEVVPSIVDVSRVRVETTATKVLYVNPIPTRGFPTAVAIARLCPQLEFVFQESQRLSVADWRFLREQLETTSNIELRPFTDERASVYRDAAVLLVPYEVDNRPRVVLEAQANGIPVVAADRPGLDEAVGAGGMLVPPGSPPERWAATLRAILEDPALHARLSASARAHARRRDVDPERLADQFESALRTLRRAPVL